MADGLRTILAFVVAIGVLVVVHEFGHFWVARRLGVKVLRFSVGFGKTIWSRRFGKDRVEFVLAAIPLGGYVRMLDENEGEVPAKDRRRAFNRQPIWKRVAIVVAGPMFNFLFAILAYWIVFVWGMEGIKPVVAQVADGSPAQHAGFRVGDEIVAIDGKDVLTWDHRRLYLFQRALDRAVVNFEVRDTDGSMRTRAVDLSNYSARDINAGLVERGIGISHLPDFPAVIGGVEEGPAKRAGLKEGDRITKIDGQPIKNFEHLVGVINAAPEKLLRVELDRDGKKVDVYLKPDAKEQEGKIIGRIMVRPKVPTMPEDIRTTLRLPIGTALVESVSTTWNMSWLTLEMLWRMLRLEISADSISGPLTIAQYAGVSAKIGLDHFIIFLAVISISLGVLNLLPIPVLDGGHLLFYLIEGIKGGPLSEKAIMAGQRIGIVLLVMLMTLALYNDVMRYDITRFFR